jgi:pimeloyl-ACP methyl ester carboxylesterase
VNDAVRSAFLGAFKVRILVVILVVIVLAIGLLWLGQRRIIYLPDRSAPVPTAPVREIAISTSDGLRLSAWLVPSSGPDRGIAVLVAPGNAGNRAHRLPLAAAMARAGLTVLLLDYRGYGGNPGGPSEEGLAYDVRAGLTYLTGAGFGRDRIVYFGESLGAAVVTELAVEHPPAGLVLRSPFVDLASVGAQLYPFLPVRWLLRDRFPVAEHITRVAVPTTVIYGTADSVVAPEQSRTVADRGAGPVRVVVIEGADHNDPSLTDGVAVIDAVTELAGRIRPPA